MKRNWKRNIQPSKKKMKQNRQVQNEDVKDTESLRAQEIPNSMEHSGISKEDKKMKGKVKPIKFWYKQEDLPKYDNSNSKDTDVEASSAREASCNVCETVFSRDSSDLVRVSDCEHRFCKVCIESYLLKKIPEDATHVLCPKSNCKHVLKPDFCHKLIPEQVFDRWKSVLTLASAFKKMKIECPYFDCQKLFMDDGKGYEIRSCPKCWKFICMPCGGEKWHNGLDCETARLNRYMDPYGCSLGRQPNARFGRRRDHRYGSIHDYRYGSIHDYRFPDSYHDFDEFLE